jgi:hypothetical protein
VDKEMCLNYFEGLLGLEQIELARVMVGFIQFNQGEDSMYNFCYLVDFVLLLMKPRLEA